MAGEETSGTDDGGPPHWSLQHWSVPLRGVTESIVTTLGPNERWNVAALGIHAPTDDHAPDAETELATARTWGRTRTRRNFAERGRGYVQFTRDPKAFVEAALAVWELEEPIIPSADAWVDVRVERIDSGTEAGTEWVDWALRPTDAEVEVHAVPVHNRGYAALVEATVAGSRLDVEGYDEQRLRERLGWLSGVIERCGGEPEQAALNRLRQLLPEDEES